MKTLQRHRLAARYFSLSQKAKNWFVRQPFKFLPAHVRLGQIGAGYRDARLLYLAAKLGIADEIAEQTVSIEMLSKRLIVNTEALYRLLRSLAALGIFNEIKPQVFVNTRLSELLRRHKKNNVVNKILADNSVQKSVVWLDELELNFGHSFPQVSVSKPCESDALPNIQSSESTGNVSSGANPYCDFDWSKFDLVFDLGFATGAHLSYILQCENELNICVFDKPLTIRSARKKWLSDQKFSSILRVSFEEGDILKSMPKATTNKHLYCFVSVFRELNDKDALLALDNIRKVLGGYQTTVVIFDAVLPETKADRLITLSDMQLLVEKTGKERTLSQWESLFMKSAFQLAELVTLRSTKSALVLTLKQSFYCR
jgi:hypothetical protein